MKNELETEELQPKPRQPGLSGIEYLDHPTIKNLIKKNFSTWDSGDKRSLAQFLSNRGVINISNEDILIQNIILKFSEHIDELTWTDPEFRQIADPICAFILPPNPGVWPPPNYLQVLERINVLQGGQVGNLGNQGEPLEFIRGCNNYIICDTVTTFERLVGALKSHYQNIGIVRTNPTQILDI